MNDRSGTTPRFLFVAALVLLLVGCSSKAAESPSKNPATPTSAPAAATNYTLTCTTVTKESVQVTDYHQGWGKNISFCRGKMTGGLTPEQDAAAAFTAGTGGSPADRVLTIYGTCAEDGVHAYADPKGPNWQGDPATIPAAAVAVHAGDLRGNLALCPDHPFADGWKQWLDKVPS